MNTNQGIKVKAMCLLVLNDHILVADGNSMESSYRPVEANDFYRVLGGSIDFNEDTESAIRREIREEIKTEIENLEKLDVIENRFDYANRREHEIVFLYKGTPAKKDWYMSKPIHIVEETYEFDAIWVPIKEILKGDIPLYPETDWSKYDI